MPKKFWVMILWIIVWQIGAMVIGKEIILPQPIGVIGRLSELALTGRFWASVFGSVTKILVGFGLGLFAGIMLAGLSSYKPVYYLLSTPMSALKSTPVASITVLLLIWVRSSYLSVLISFFMVMPIIYFNTLEGIRSIDNKLLEMAKLFCLKPVIILKHITIPSVLPYVLPGATTGLGFAWKSGVAAEIIGLPANSIGVNIYNAKVLLETQSLFAWTLVVILLSSLMERGFVLLAEKFRKAEEV